MSDAPTAAPPRYAVIDPRSPRAEMWMEAFGRDYVEMESERIWELPNTSLFRLKVSSLGQDALTRACRVYGRETLRAWDEIFWEAVHGSGMWLYADRVVVVADPEEGRRYWKEGGRDGAT